MKEIKYGIEYQLPEVLLLQESGIGVSEIAARTCYDSFENSENACILDMKEMPFKEMIDWELEEHLDSVNTIDSSKLLDSLAWVYHHHSIIEHATLSFLIKGTSRAVLQEHARHRIQSISVRSTRYTMSGVINAFIASVADFNSQDKFVKFIQSMDMFVTAGEKYNEIQIRDIFNKLNIQMQNLGKEEFFKIAVAKTSLIYLKDEFNSDEIFDILQSGKKKRNVGDAFKHIVSDNWKVDMVVTFNIRSLKNYFDLRDSGAAFFQIQWLAKAMKLVTPIKYKRLIDKDYK